MGIGTTTPQATLDLREANPAAPTAKAGIAIPQVSILPSTGNRAGQLIYLTTSNSYYFYNGSSWKALSSVSSAIIGDVKNGYQTTDHNGWILLNGRLKTTLTATQQAAATALGIGANLPNISDKSIVGSSATKALNTVGGSDNATISRDQLPNIVLTASTEGNHTHTIGEYYNKNVSLQLGSVSIRVLDTGYSFTQSNAQGNHTHIIEPLNGGVTQNNLNIQNPYITMNGFIYLGL
ncbi:MAG: hypothetical protein ABI426_11965 [Flavobacterium sp.]